MNLIKKSIIAAACAGAAVFAGNAMAAGTQTLIIGANVQGVCKFTSADTYLMAFGAIDGSAGTDLTKNLPISYLCTSGTAASSILVGGAGSGVTLNMDHIEPVSSEKLPVTLTWTTPKTLGTGFASSAAPITLDLTGTIKAANLQGAAAGRYLARSIISILP